MLSWSSRRVPIAWTLIGTFCIFSSRLVAVMMISVSSGTPAAAWACLTGSGGDVTSVAFVPGAGDWVVGVAGVASDGAGACAKAGEASAVEASSPSASARNERSVIANAPIRLGAGIATEAGQLVNRRGSANAPIVTLALQEGRGRLRVSI